MKFKTFCQWLRILLFSIALVGLCILGFLTFLRPEISDKEERKLTEFPTFSVKTFLSGEYTSEINLWYADTFPGRDMLLDMNTDLKALYGIHTQSFGGGNVNKDEINKDEDFIWEDESPSESVQTPTVSFPDTPTEPTQRPGDSDTSETDAPSDLPTEDGPDQSVGGQMIEGYYVNKNTAFELYYFNKSHVDRYTRVVTQAAINLSGLATVYNMIIPTSCNYGMTPELIEEVGASNESDAIDYIYRALNSYSTQLVEQERLEKPIVTLDIRDLMGEHYDEYIYFRTDHHWTGLGAYYASRFFLDQVGRTYPSLDAYRKVVIPDFLGSLYNHTQSPSLKNSPDTVYAYESPTLKEITTWYDGVYHTLPLITEADALANKWNKYLAFTQGDWAYFEMHNETITDGSSVLVIRESFGNAFMPMLVDSYEYVYGIDYRYWRDDLATFVKEKGIDTVIFLNNIMATVNDYTVRTIETLVD